MDNECKVCGDPIPDEDFICDWCEEEQDFMVDDVEDFDADEFLTVWDDEDDDDTE